MCAEHCKIELQRNVIQGIELWAGVPKIIWNPIDVGVKETSTFSLFCHRWPHQVWPWGCLLPSPGHNLGPTPTKSDADSPHHAADIPEPGAASWLQLHQPAILHRGPGPPQHLPVWACCVPCEYLALVSLLVVRDPNSEHYLQFPFLTWEEVIELELVGLE
jgi:hypothetical protein